MKWITHIAFALFIVKLTEIALMIDLLDSYVAYAVVTFFTVLPDLDFLIGLKHRTYTHTIYFTAFAFILLPLDLKLAFIAWISIFSHLIADMMTVSGVKLFYPKPTVYYILPPEWRIRVGSNSEFFILGALILGTVLIGNVAGVTELQKVYDLSRDHDVAIRLSWIENGVVYSSEYEKVVWTDYKSKIGIIRNGKLKILNDEQILNVEIVNSHKVHRYLKHATVKVKDLKRSVWKNRLIVEYDDGDYHEFLGTGRDLYYKLKNNPNQKIKVAYVCSRSSEFSQSSAGIT